MGKGEVSSMFRTLLGTSSTQKAAFLATSAFVAFAASGGSAAASTGPDATTGMIAASYVSESPGTNGQTNILDSAGQVVSIAASVALALNTDRQTDGLSAIPVVTLSEASSERTRIKWQRAFGATGKLGLLPDNNVSKQGNCGSAGVDLEKASSVSASWFTDWDVFSNVTGTIESFSWRVSGTKIDTKSWDQGYGYDSWASDVFYPAHGSGTYTATIAVGTSFAIGEKTICYAGSGITATTTV